MSVETTVSLLEDAFPDMPFRYNVSWKEVTTLGIGGPIALLAEPPDDLTLASLLEFCDRKNIKTFILGNGSNVLGPDNVFEGLVIQLRHNDFVKVKFASTHVTVGAGTRLYDLVHSGANHSLGGISSLAGIPASVGGALKMNAGAGDTVISDYLIELCGFTHNGEPWCADRDAIDWQYRRSNLPEDVIITAAIFEFDKVDKAEELEKIKTELQRRRQFSSCSKSAGCFFLNPDKATSAGKLIDLSGGKNMSCGGASVSSIHANYLVNSNNATEEDLINLACQVKQKVFRDTGIILSPEINILNPDAEKKLKMAVQPPTIALLKGGNSSEREVSLVSGKAVANALRNAGMIVDEIDIKQPEITQAMRDAEVVFPVLHGGFGENGELQKILEDSKLKFVGCGSEACFWIFDKVKSKKIMLDSNLPTPPYAVFNSADAEFPETLSLPLVVKPANEGSTVGISLVSNKDVWQTALAEAMKYDSKVLVEQYVEGVEITVGVVDGTPLPPVEIQFPGKMYDYDAKYTHSKGETRYLCPPERLSEELQKKAMEIAEAFYKAFKVSDMVRVDMIVDTEENIWILEGNNLPGFTPDSLLPKAAKAAGYSFTELCAKLVASHL